MPHSQLVVSLNTIENQGHTVAKLFNKMVCNQTLLLGQVHARSTVSFAKYILKTTTQQMGQWKLLKSDWAK